MALVSVDEMETKSVTVLTTFQLASTTFTAMVKGVFAICAAGGPVLPVDVPGAAFSPGTSSCSFVDALELITMLSEVAPINPVAVKLRVVVPALRQLKSVNATRPSEATIL